MSKTREGRKNVLYKYIEKKWEEYYWNFLMKYVDRLEWHWISCNPNTTIGMIEKYPNKPWDWNWISYNPNITMEMIEKHIDKIDFEYLSKNKFTFENTRINKKEGYLLLEKERSFHKLMNLYVIKNYM